MRYAGEHEGQIDVVAQGKGIQQVELLEDKAQMLAAEGRKLLFRHGVQVASAKEHLTSGGLVEPGENVEQRRLARAGFAHDGDKLAFAYGEMDIGQRMDGRAAEARDIGLLKTPDIENGHENLPQACRCREWA